jgi:hypothetical protein
MPHVTEDNLTDVVLERWKEIRDPRLRQIMQSLQRSRRRSTPGPRPPLTLGATRR